MTKIEAGSLYQISVYWLKKYKYLECNSLGYGTSLWKNRWGETEFEVTLRTSTVKPESYINLSYVHRSWEGEEESVDYKVFLETTPCYFGGERFWFTCPLWREGRECRRRVGVLYKVGKYFGCRHCYKLTYSSCNRSGIHKKLSNVSIPELERMEKEMRVKFYKGEPTKKYKRYERKNFEIFRDLQVMAKHFYKRG